MSHTGSSTSDGNNLSTHVKVSNWSTKHVDVHHVFRHTLNPPSSPEGRLENPPTGNHVNQGGVPSFSLQVSQQQQVFPIRLDPTRSTDPMCHPTQFLNEDRYALCWTTSILVSALRQFETRQISPASELSEQYCKQIPK